MTSHNAIALTGCRVEPLASYLKSIGIARLISEQADPSVRVWFQASAMLQTELSASDLVDYFVSQYRPTPILNPWNKGSGFGPTDEESSKSAFGAVTAIEASDDPRLEPYRTSIMVVREVLDRPDWSELAKEQQAAALRSTLPDEALDWIDAAIVLTSTSRAFPPILGTGGNDGRLDFSSTFMQRIGELFGLADRPIKPGDVRQLAADALFGTSLAKLRPSSLGQFDPLASGGPRSAPAGSANALSNPWDAVLMFEGAVAFASGVARRLGSRQSVSSVPFTVTAAPTGYAAATAEKSRGEFWAPVWNKPASYPDIAHMLREGRVEYRGVQARNGLDAALALATLGIDRGISSFVRYSFAERNGLATMAVPVDRVPVTTNMAANLLGPVTTWLDRFRGSHLPSSVEHLAATARRSVYAIAQSTESSAGPLLAELLKTLAHLDSLAARSTSTRSSVGYSPQGLSATGWLAAMNDASHEFLVARSLASWRQPGSATGIIRRATHPGWQGGRSQVIGLGRRPLDQVLGDVLGWWSHEADVDRLDSQSRANAWGGDVTATWCPPEAFAALASSQLDMSRVESFLTGLLLLDWSRFRERSVTPPTMPLEDAEPGVTSGIDDGGEVIVETRNPGVLWTTPAWIAALKVCFHHRSAAHAIGCRPLVATTGLARLVQSQQRSEALAAAFHQLQVAGLQPRFAAAHTHPDPHAPISTALLTPVSDAAIRQLASQISRSAEPVAAQTDSSVAP